MLTLSWKRRSRLSSVPARRPHRDRLRRVLVIGIGGLLALGDTPQGLGMVDARVSWRRSVVAEEDFPHFTRGIEDQNVAGDRVCPPPTERSVERQAEQHRPGQQPIDGCDPSFRGTAPGCLVPVRCGPFPRRERTSPPRSPRSMYRSGSIPEIRYHASQLGADPAGLDGLIYTGVLTAGGGFEDRLYARSATDEGPVRPT